MVIRDVSDQYRITLGDLTPPGAPPRTPGVHLSQIVRHIAIANGILAAPSSSPSSSQQENDLAGAMDVERMAAGCAWEDWLARKMEREQRGFCYHIGEITKDGITGSVDALQAFPTCTVVHEFKFTWKGSHKGIEGQWMWWTQLKGYCALVGATRGILHVYYCNSDYRNSTRRYYVYDAEFGLAELRETWDMLVRHRDMVEPETGEART